MRKAIISSLLILTATSQAFAQPGAEPPGQTLPGQDDQRIEAHPDTTLLAMASQMAEADAARLRRSASTRTVIGSVVTALGGAILYAGADLGNDKEPEAAVVGTFIGLIGIGVAVGGVVTLVSAHKRSKAAKRRLRNVHVAPTAHGVSAGFSGSF